MGTSTALNKAASNLDSYMNADYASANLWPALL